MHKAQRNEHGLAYLVVATGRIFEVLLDGGRCCGTHVLPVIARLEARQTALVTLQESNRILRYDYARRMSLV